MWEYSDKVKEHYKNPKNVGSIENADAIGEAGALSCGDALKIYLKIDKGIITDAKFQTFGCGSAVASSSILTEMLIGKTVEEASTITNKQIADMLGGLPPEKMHCSVMGREALEDALANYSGEKKQKGKKSGKKIICNCFDISEDEIKEAIEHKGVKTVKEITELTYAGGACGRCKDNIQTIINTMTMQEIESKKPATPMNTIQFVLKINNVIEKNIAPELAKDNGSIELVNVEEKTVYVSLKGACKGCKNSSLTLKNFVEAQLKELVDSDISVVEVD